MRTLAFCFSVLVTVFVSAQQMPREFPTVEKVPGQPIRIWWKDGRVAVIRGQLGTVHTLNVPFKITESLCASTAPVECSQAMSVTVGITAGVWEKHPDPTHVGQLITRAKMPVRYQSVIGRGFSSLTSKHDPILQKLPPQRLTCPDFGWTGQGTTTAPASLRIQNWENEVMVPNPETGVNENRAISGHMGVELKAVATDTLEMTSEGWATSEFIPVVGAINIQNLTVETPQGGNCLVAVSSLLTQLDQVIQIPEVLTNEQLLAGELWMTGAKGMLFQSPGFGSDDQIMNDLQFGGGFD